MVWKIEIQLCKPGNCPFCGSQDVEETFQIGNLACPVKFFVFCWHCHARGPEALSSEEAILRWNNLKINAA